MESKAKKTLRLKIAIISLISVLIPSFVLLFIPLNPILFIFLSLGIAALSVGALFWILKPLGSLVSSIHNFSEGKFNQRVDIRSGDELEEIGNSFNLLADRLSKTIHNLEYNQGIAVTEKDRLNEILSSVIDGIIALDFNNNIIFLNKAAEELTGYTQTEAFGKPIDQIIHLFLDTQEIFSKTYCQESFNQSTKVIGKDGKQTKVNFITTHVGTTIQTNLNCILILHDLSKEEELEQMKLDFVSMASHELKTPLTSIIGYLSVFLDENKDKLTKENAELLEKAFVASQQLQTLVLNLLNVNRIEREQLSVSPEPTNYLPLLTKVIEDLKNQANQKNIVLSLNPLPDNLPKVLADPIRLSEVLTNLVSNAINYTNPGGKVEISVQTSPTFVKTIVSDTGIGIPQEAIPHLFNKFFRVSNQLQKANKGTGLGLYITKSIIEKLHGEIWVESQIGQGSRFCFTLPVAHLTILDNNQFVSQALQSGTLNY